MNQVTRISLRIVRREISFAVGDTATAKAQTGGLVPVSGHEPASCAVCGAPWVHGFERALLDGEISLSPLKAAILDNQLHLHQLPDGGIWICRQSWLQLTGKQPTGKLP